MNTATTKMGLSYHRSSPSADGRDRGYILRSMTQQLMRVPGYRELGDKGLRPYIRELEDRLDDQTTIKVIARDPDDPWLILGFVIGSPGIVTWLQVRGSYRNLGLASALARELAIDRQTDAVVEFPTWDLLRRTATQHGPIGLLHNPNWHLTLVPWTQER